MSLNWHQILKRSTIIILGPLWSLAFFLAPIAYPVIWLLTGKHFYTVMDSWAYKIDDWVKWIKS